MAMAPEGHPRPHEQNPRHQEINRLLEQFLTPSESPHNLLPTLKSLHQALVDLSAKNDGNRQHPTTSPPLDIHDTSSSPEASKSPTYADASSSAQQLIQHVAEVLINSDRVIYSVDDEIDNDDYSPDFRVEHENDCKWYKDTMSVLTSGSCATDSESITSSCDDPERWVDSCLDMCGYKISLEKAVACLRQIVHESSMSANATSSSTSNVLVFKKNRKCPGFAPAITSLRTIRRRLIPHSSISDFPGDGSLMCLPEAYCDLFFGLQNIFGVKTSRLLCRHIILPVEYKVRNERRRKQTATVHHFSGSLASFSTSVLPSLVASACYAINLPLPSWATPKSSCRLLIQSAWKALLAGDLIKSAARLSNKDCPNIVEFAGEIKAAVSNHYRLITSQIIENGRSEIAVHHLYHCWKACDSFAGNDGNTLRSILCEETQTLLSSIPSKREVSLFCLANLRYCVKQETPKSRADSLRSRHSRDELHGICKTAILPFLQGVFPPLSKDEQLVEALVNFIVLSPPTSFRGQGDSSTKSFPSLHMLDLMVPRCLVQLLVSALNANDNSASNTYKAGSDGDDSEADCDSIVLSQLFAVASVWCEDVFITRTGILQQQYVTEFLCYPLESKYVSQGDLQKDLSENGSSLATMIVQGVSLRMDVSRSDSIRIDGMRVAEALASILGQTLRFDELHPSEEEKDGGSDEHQTEVNKESKKKKTKHKVGKPKALPKIVVDPDAEYFTDDDDSSSNGAQSNSSTSSNDSDESSDGESSWGEDSLEPYSMNDDEEDLRRVPRPHTLRECLAYLTTSEKDNSAYDKQHSALEELAAIVSAEPLDLLDVSPILVRILLFLEDKFSMDRFSARRWESLMSFGIHAPLETCMLLVEEMKGNISLGTRMEALSLLGAVALELSGVTSQESKAISSALDVEIANCSTRLQHGLTLGGQGVVNNTESSTTQSSRTRRWRRPHSFPTTTTNKFGPISVQMIYSLFAFLSQTRASESIWGGAIGEKFLCEFLKTISIMIHCARNYPSPALRVLAADLFDLAWTFHDAKCAEVRWAALMAMATCVSIVPVEFIIDRASRGLGTFLHYCATSDDNANCRRLAAILGSSVSEVLNVNMIEKQA